MEELHPVETRGDVRRDISLRMAMLTRAMRGDFDRRVSAHGITRSQWTVIAVVAGMPGASQRTIADMLQVSEAAAGRTIDKLCSDGLLERRARSEDRRAREVFLTPNATCVLERIGEVASAGEDVSFAGFREDELQVLLQALDRIYANVTGSAPPQKKAAPGEAPPSR